MDLQFPPIWALAGKLASVVWAWNSGSEPLPQPFLQSHPPHCSGAIQAPNLPLYDSLSICGHIYVLLNSSGLLCLELPAVGPAPGSVYGLFLCFILFCFVW